MRKERGRPRDPNSFSMGVGTSDFGSALIRAVSQGRARVGRDLMIISVHLMELKLDDLGI